MQQHRFENLRERLLRAGVSPRHVRRYLDELRDHHDDALRAELAKGTPLAAAREAAWARLGTEESLVEGVIVRPELRSTVARFPALVFGLGPMLAWLGVPFAFVGALGFFSEAIRGARPSAGFVDASVALGFFQTRLLPVVVGAVALEITARRRLRTRWALLGAGVVDLLAGTLTFYALPGQLGITSSLLPWLQPFSTALGPKDPLALGEGLLRAACMLVLSLVVLRVLRRLGFSDKPSLAAE